VAAVANETGANEAFFSTRRCGYTAAAWPNPERINVVKALPLLSCLLVAACANLETKPWFKVDGNPASAEQLDLDKTTCRQEMQKSVQATTQAAALDYNIVRSDVFETCMSRLGYSDKNNGRSTAPAVIQGGPAPPVAQASPAPTAVQGRTAPTANQGRIAPAAVQGGTVPTTAQSGTMPPPVQGNQPPPSDQECRTPMDFRMWLPLCP